MSAAVYAYLGLGSNLEDPRQQLSRAIEALAELPQSRLINVSSYYRSKPVGPQNQPDFINAAACLETQLEALTLLDHLQAIEQQHGRERLQHWGPRTLDLDILLYGDAHIDTERLQVPHPFLTQRSFVLLPLADIAPGIQLPDGQNLQALAEQCNRADITPLDPPTGTGIGDSLK
ncbi:2-amino-4-hydroxy-6-hydroxymethyldihydropteridine diphosphokinase [Gilvimarinus agarilyticus]|uniref:2-amino-4-hydroxy-6- hydroxymethyldihydropteridine diphosphokinase n=1 Tax=unclassified Gilvimarinus TaxID=2642066 RepID=UPI001C0927C6|nr:MULTISPECIES: 2-amino-4-hydroxy-6-hydroxymethyldihydropteridine diphosphokinase [unclassified Gilvimarinus]MBU2886103.1 2-amino-4-hydroxy-6-hydroxymethyldihydropteridine diphosphokinase [Gilvimarinus agarilyticus]MDO6570813.1 2-amino-4-hydroxy-6-hydroxymethyldihydropteridine diphosphokinase [Gilvimarinus sp. 2_MG-2023]MDO6746981.1 2-amino-4-hydroxy-6-hydroxymethyldihydropteridine diphosphokinase [Gilvimarinus sp. 1_MG-2023]